MAVCVCGLLPALGHASAGTTSRTASIPPTPSAPRTVRRTSPAHRTSSPPKVPLGGINVVGLEYGSSIAEADREVTQAHLLHAKVVRMIMRWSVLEPLGSGQLDPGALAFVDRLVNDAASDGMGVIMTVDSPPCWASSAPASLLLACVPGQTSAASNWPPAEPATYAALLSLLASRYSTKLTALEVWNEPDQANELYFAGPEKPQRYAALVRAGYTAVKQVNPAIKLLAGSLVGSNGVFLRELYAAGMKGFYDGLAIHFYTLTLGAVRSIHEVQVANGDPTPLWLDEFGWSSCLPQKTQQEQACVTPQIQAANLSDTFRSLARASYVAAVVPYELQGYKVEDFGVLSETGAHKPAWKALSQVLVSPLGKPTPVILRLRRRGSSVVASGSGPVGDFMRLEAFRGSLRYQAFLVLDRYNRYSVKLPRALGTHGLRVLIYQYWQGAHSAIQRRI